MAKGHLPPRNFVYELDVLELEMDALELMSLCSLFGISKLSTSAFSPT